MSKEAMKPFGLALEKYFKGDKDIKIIYHRDDGQETEDLIEGYFRTYPNFSELEKIAIDRCKGKILDIGSGTGPHTLELQKRGFDVLAIDISKKACEIMKKRGVKRTECKTPYEINEKNFDTIIILGCSIGFVADLKGLKRFLKYAKTLLSKEGFILMDSRDIRITDNSKHIEYQQNNTRKGKYRGEIRLQIEFNGVKGELFQILHIDPDTLKDLAKDLGWKCEILSENESGLYLAKLKELS
jgi:SAM-dependent methyltransferase